MENHREGQEHQGGESSQRIGTPRPQVRDETVSAKERVGMDRG